MQSYEMSSNPEIKTPVKSWVKTRSMHRMTQQSASEEKTQHPLPASIEPQEAANHDFSQESIAAILSIEAAP